MFLNNRVSRTSSSNRTHLSVEVLEDRRVPTTGLLASNIGTVATVMQLPPNPALTWIDQNIHDSSIHGLARQLEGDGQLSRNDMLAIFNQVSTNLSQQHRGLSTTEYSDLQALVNNASILNMPAYVQNLASKVVNDNPANFQINTSTGTTQILGDLSVGSSALQLTELTGKWFLGNDHPSIPTTYQYHLASGSLFGNGISFQDVQQGQVGDCWLLASLEEIAVQDPQIITNMFIDNHDGTYTVCFYNQGVADYVTVDGWLPTDATQHFIYASWPGSNPNRTQADGYVWNTSNKLWVAYVEKAYAQLGQEDWDGRSTVNSYDSLDSGKPRDVLPILTNHQTTWGYLSGSVPNFMADMAAGKMVVFTTGTTTTGLQDVVDSHVYALWSYYSNGQFILVNPWGVDAVDNRTGHQGQFAGYVVMNVQQMEAAGFTSWAEVDPTKPAVSPFGHVIVTVGTATVTQVSAGAETNTSADDHIGRIVLLSTTVKDSAPVNALATAIFFEQAGEQQPMHIRGFGESGEVFSCDSQMALSRILAGEQGNAA